MTLPRWLVVSLLTVSVFAVLGASAWWWATWPERTAREFAELLVSRRFDDAIPMIDCHRGLTKQSLTMLTRDWQGACFQCRRRTAIDFILSRQEYQVRGAYTPRRCGMPSHSPGSRSVCKSERGLRFIAERGKVRQANTIIGSLELGEIYRMEGVVRSESLDESSFRSLCWIAPNGTVVSYGVSSSAE